MKIKYLLFALVFGAIVACDPQVEDRDLKVTSISELKGSIVQYTMNEDSTYSEYQYGKYIKYEFPDVPSVYVYYMEDDNEITLDSGKGGGMFMFRIATEVVELTTQDVYFRYVDVYGEEYTYSTTITFETTPLNPEELYFSGMNGKAWRWDTESPVGICWGNGGFRAGTFDEIFNGSGKWWGINTTDDESDGGFLGQIDHMTEGETFEQSGGDVDSTYMAVSLSGSITCYRGIGNLSEDKVIRANGTYQFVDYDETGESHRGFYQGHMITSAGAILWPYEINSGGNQPTEFEVVKLTSEQLLLCYPDGGFADDDESMDWSWGECTYWYFRYDPSIEVNIETPEESLMADKGWTWASDEFAYGTPTSYAACWGNCGYGGGDSDAYAPGGSGCWWGCTTDDFYDQFCSDGSSHKIDSSIVEAEGEGAYMTFDKSGNIKKYDPNGDKVGEGKYEVDWDHKTDNGGFNTTTYGLMTVSGDNILLPYQINGGGSKADWYDIAYIDSDYLILINQRDDLGGETTFPAYWSEATWWRFEKRK